MKLTVLDDTPLIPSCRVLYTPQSEAFEYAPLATSPYLGCGHKCKYCFVPRHRHITRESFDAGAVPRKDYLKLLARDAAKYQRAGIIEQALIAFMTDPYHPGDTTLTRPTIEMLIAHGLGVCILTKGGTKALRDLDLYRPNRDAFFTTLTSLDDDFSLKWESAAPLPSDRIAAIQRFHEAGIYTIVSLEPTLDIEHSLAVLEVTHGFVDLFKIGRANDLGALTKTTDWQGYTLRMADRLHHWGNAHYFKRSLQPYLPDGYVNLLRRRQHH